MPSEGLTYSFTRKDMGSFGGFWVEMSIDLTHDLGTL